MPSMFHDGCHSNSMLEVLHGFQKSGMLCDVTVRVEDLAIPVHKTVISAASPYFRAMFSSGLSECQNGEVEMKDIAPDAIAALIDFTYTGSVQITDENVQDLLAASDLLQITSVKAACAEYLIRQLHPSNCIHIKQFGSLYSCQDLEDMAGKFCMSRLSDLIVEDEFLELSCHSLEILVRSPDRDVHFEGSVLEAILAWVKHNIPARHGHLDYLLRHVRLNKVCDFHMRHLSQNRELITSLTTDDAVENCVGSLSQETTHLSVNGMTPEEVESHKALHCQATEKMVLVAIAGESVGVTLTTCECYDDVTNRWTAFFPSVVDPTVRGPFIGELNSGRSHMAIVTTQSYIYAIGGKDSWIPLDSVERYDLRTNKWQVIAPLRKAYHGSSSSPLNNRVYVTGGYDGENYLNQVEAYNDMSGQWDVMPSMKDCRSFHKTASTGGFLYAIGGQASDEGANTIYLNAAERFDPSLQTWSSIAPMHEARAYVAITSLNGFIFSGGGYNGNTVLNSVERYDPSCNQWSMLTVMKTPRSHHAMSTLNGYIYAMGGFDGKANLNSCERYCSKKKAWQKVCPMQCRRYGMESVTYTLSDKLLKKLMTSES